ncbi:hypothetical protein SEA_GODONK_30 [Gordonia phage GodonK]|uniref:Uncharacterized protein n=1 Tax=Gordonia phage GodonK TaxID=2562192 RepID=A0A4D6E1V3_9CAUD|nr:hypothetical protein HOV33_gp030 [Gordonia phage GodonK]QBZ72649.1 hypothetical protein SEA_GODONK_30 [Gordonia phage GodonK]
MIVELAQCARSMHPARLVRAYRSGVPGWEFVCPCIHPESRSEVERPWYQEDRLPSAKFRLLAHLGSRVGGDFHTVCTPEGEWVGEMK